MMLSYLISLTTSQHDLETTVAILNIIGPGHVIVGSGDSTLRVVPKSRKSKEEILTQLKALPSTQAVSVVKLSNPVKGSELNDVRALIADFGLDASGITDEDLSLFLNTKLQGLYTYYLKLEPGQRRGLTKIYVRPAAEIPGYIEEPSEERSVIAEEALDKVYTVDDIEVRSVELSTVVFEEPPSSEGEDTEKV